MTPPHLCQECDGLGTIHRNAGAAGIEYPCICHYCNGTGQAHQETAHA